MGVSGTFSAVSALFDQLLMRRRKPFEGLKKNLTPHGVKNVLLTAEVSVPQASLTGRIYPSSHTGW